MSRLLASLALASHPSRFGHAVTAERERAKKMARSTVFGEMMGRGSTPEHDGGLSRIFPPPSLNPCPLARSVPPLLTSRILVRKGTFPSVTASQVPILPHHRMNRRTASRPFHMKRRGRGFKRSHQRTKSSGPCREISRMVKTEDRESIKIHINVITCTL